jgi:peroxiredoxin
MKIRTLLLTLALAATALVATRTTDAAETAAPATATVGQPAPAFTLTDADGKTHSLAQYKGKTVVLEWTNPGCPFVVRHYDAQTMKKLAGQHKDVVWLAVNSTATNTADDSKKWAKDKGLPYPTLLDTDGKVGKVYGARTTPHMFVIDGKGVLRYAGAIDSDPKGKGGTVTSYVGDALTALAAGKAPSPASTEPYGCSVKYAK